MGRNAPRHMADDGRDGRGLRATRLVTGLATAATGGICLLLSWPDVVPSFLSMFVVFVGALASGQAAGDIWSARKGDVR